jgi:hypothetical protein
MKLLIVLALLLSGCVTPVKREFPKIPPALIAQCAPLKEVASTAKLSDVLTTVTENYSLYHECELRVVSWQDWYAEQKKIFDSVD